MVDVDGKIPASSVSVEAATQGMMEHIQLYLEDGSAAHMWDTTDLGGPGLVTTLLLKTVGAKSGADRLSPLIYGEADGAWVVIGSGGNERHPHWYDNLVASPDVEIKVGSQSLFVRARTATGKERERLWAHMVEVYPPYGSYQASTEREIPVVVLEER